MLRQKKNLKTKTPFFKSNYKFSLYVRLKKLAFLVKKAKVKYKVYIKIKQNNIFCTFINIRTNHIILVASAGKLKLNVSKKKLRFLQKKIILKFLKKIRFILRRPPTNTLLIEFIGPKRLRKRIIRHFKILKQRRKISTLFLLLRPLKLFNGCRPLKKKRKKGFRHKINV